MTYKPQDLGIAERQNYFEVPMSDVAALSAAEEPSHFTADDAAARRYAIYTYSVGSNPSAATAASSGIINAINAGNGPFSIYQEEDTLNNIFWTAEAEPGSPLSAAVWRIRRTVYTTGALNTTRTTWADGNRNFDNVATSPLSGLAYT